MGKGYIVRRGGGGQQTVKPIYNSLTEVGFTSLILNVTNDSTKDAVIYYSVVNAEPSPNQVGTFDTEFIGKETKNITITGLTAGTTYTVYLKALAPGEFPSETVLVSNLTTNIALNATGGTTAEYNLDGKRYRSHTFTGNGTFQVTQLSSVVNQVDVLVVAGGGSGGGHASPGGGGAGGLVYKTGQSVTTTNYGINVGAGGAQAINQTTFRVGNKGTNSTAFSLTAVGGGGGVSWGAGTSVQLNSINGGSTGGYGQGGDVNSGVPTAQQTLQSGESGSLGFGNRGGVAGSYTTPYPGGGGGGAGAVGQNGPNGSTAGAGGVGRQYDIRNGTLVYYAGGGGGGGWSTVSGMLGGLGGGGRGDCSAGTSGSGTSSRGFTNRAEGEAGAVNTGGGGGAAGRTGGELSIGAAGGSGLVVIRYEIAPV